MTGRNKTEKAGNAHVPLESRQSAALEDRRRVVRNTLVSAGLVASSGVLTKLLSRPAAAGTPIPTTTSPPTQVPEPSTLMLFGAGAAALLVAARAKASRSRRSENESEDEV